MSRLALKVVDCVEVFQSEEIAQLSIKKRRRLLAYWSKPTVTVTASQPTCFKVQKKCFSFVCLGCQLDEPRRSYRECRVRSNSGEIHSAWIQRAERTVMVSIQGARVDNGVAAILFKLTTLQSTSPPPRELPDQEVAPETSLPTNQNSKR